MARRKSTGCIAMILFLIVGGIFTGVGYFMMLRPEMEVGSRFVEGTCTVLGKELISEKSSSKRSRRSDKTVYRPEFHIRHEVGGETYEVRTHRIVKSSSSGKTSEEKTLARFEVGKTYPCWYDPTDPSRVVLEKGVSTGSWLFTGLGVLVLLIGVGGGAIGLLRRVMGAAG